MLWWYDLYNTSPKKKHVIVTYGVIANQCSHWCGDLLLNWGLPQPVYELASQ